MLLLILTFKMPVGLNKVFAVSIEIPLACSEMLQSDYVYLKFMHHEQLSICLDLIPCKAFSHQFLPATYQQAL